MLALTGGQQTACAARTASPALVLRIDGDDGMRYYPERAEGLAFVASGLLTSFGGAEQSMASFSCAGEERLTLRIRSTAFSLPAAIAPGVEVCLLLAFADAPAELAIPLFRGFLTEPARRVSLPEGDEYTLEIGGLQAVCGERPALRVARRTDFPALAATDEGLALPVLYGRPLRTRAVCLQGAPTAVLTSRVDSASTFFYLADASELPQATPVLLRLGDEVIAGTFSGNRFVVTQRAGVTINGTFGRRTGNPSLVRLLGIDADAIPELPGLHLRATLEGKEQQTRIVEAMADGVIKISPPFFNQFSSGFATPDPDVTFAIFSRPTIHLPGEEVRLAFRESWYLVCDAELPAQSAPVLVEAVTEDGFARLPDWCWDFFPDGSERFPAAGPAALLRLRVPPARLSENVFRGNEVYVTVEGLVPTGNPAEVIHDVLVRLGGLGAERIDDASIAAASIARAEVSFAFALQEQLTIADLLTQLCMQARVGLFWEGTGLFLRLLENGMGDTVTSPVVFGADTVTENSVRMLPGAQEGGADEQPVTLVRGVYREGAICVARDSGPEAGGREVVVPLWAFSGRDQAQAAAEWWMRRLTSPWRGVRFRAYLPAAGLRRSDAVRLELPDEAGGAVAEHAGTVESVRLLPREDGAGMDAFEITLRCPVWTGCASSCETACESGACESTGCEMSCTVTCELACQNACQTQLQNCNVWNYSACTRTCQTHCRAAAETGCGSSSCENNCEIDCETSCMGEAYETSCPTGCETATELKLIDDLVRRVRVSTAPTVIGGYAMVTDLASGENFQARDLCDLHPAINDICTAVFAASGEWLLANTGREAKLVRVVSDLGGGNYTVIESGRSGDWGEAFSAYLPS